MITDSVSPYMVSSAPNDRPLAYFPSSFFCWSTYSCEVSPAAIGASTEGLDSLGPFSLKHMSSNSLPIAYWSQKL